MCSLGRPYILGLIEPFISAIKKNEKIVIAKPDKGSGIVLLVEKEYLDRINEILNDSTKLVKLRQTSEFDNLNKTENQLWIFKEAYS